MRLGARVVGCLPAVGRWPPEPLLVEGDDVALELLDHRIIAGNGVDGEQLQAVGTEELLELERPVLVGRLPVGVDAGELLSRLADAHDGVLSPVVLEVTEDVATLGFDLPAVLGPADGAVVVDRPEERLVTVDAIQKDYPDDLELVPVYRVRKDVVLEGLPGERPVDDVALGRVNESRSLGAGSDRRGGRVGIGCEFVGGTRPRSTDSAPIRTVWRRGDGVTSGSPTHPFGSAKTPRSFPDIPPQKHLGFNHVHSQAGL